MTENQLDQIRLWHKTFKGDNELFEVRILCDRTYSGYFTDVEEMIRQLPQYDSFNIYYTINRIKDGCKNRTQYNRITMMRDKEHKTTSEGDIERRLWLPIDLDCDRPSGISSSDEEKDKAYKKAIAIYKFLKENSFPEPVVCDSSSGYHLLYPIDLDVDKQSKDIIRKFFDVLGNLFTDKYVKIDNALCDANRIIRMPGTFGRKGISTEERPHRMAKILKAGNETRRMTYDEIKNFVEKHNVDFSNNDRQRNNTFSGQQQFNVSEFIAEHNIGIAREISIGNGMTKYILSECPFDSNHKAPDSALFVMPNGAIGFKCLHNSCSHYTWSDFRKHFDPNAYDRQDTTQQQYHQQYQQQQYRPVQFSAQVPTKKYQIKDELPELGKKWLSMSDIKKVDLSELEYIPTGFRGLDQKMVGLYLGEVTIISGSNSSGKSSWLNSLILNSVQQEFKAALWSGELRADVLKTWIQMVAAGKDYLKPSSIEDRYYVPNDIADYIDKWMDGKFFLYNNEYSQKWEQIFHDMTELLKADVKLFVLDNLFSLDIDIFDGDKNNKQKELVIQLCQFAKSNNVHIILVAHPRKVTTFLRKNDICGSSDLQNAVDNILIVHRVNNDFLKAGGEFFGQGVINEYKNFGNVIEIAKNRLYGAVDCLCGMYYDIPSRRFMNDPFENIRFGWLDMLASGQIQQVYNPPTDPVREGITLNPSFDDNADNGFSTIGNDDFSCDMYINAENLPY